MDPDRIEPDLDEPTPGRFVWYGGRVMTREDMERRQERDAECEREREPGKGKGHGQC